MDRASFDNPLKSLTPSVEGKVLSGSLSSPHSFERPSLDHVSKPPSTAKSPSIPHQSSEIDREMSTDRQTMIKLRMQQDRGAVEPREFQRFHQIILSLRQNYLQPGRRESAKGKPPSKKKVILAYDEAPQDASVLLSQFSKAITELAVGIINVFCNLINTLSLP